MNWTARISADCIERYSWKQAKVAWLVIVDTAGRLAIDEQMMNEIEAIGSGDRMKHCSVVDSMTGRDAVDSP